MPLKTQVGDLATRIARGLGVRGRIPTDLDELNVPVTLLADLRDPPYADVPSYWSARLNNASAGPGVLTASGVFVQSGTALIDRVTVSPNARMFVNLSIVPDGASGLTQSDLVFTTSQRQPSSGSVLGPPMLGVVGALAGNVGIPFHEQEITTVQSGVRATVISLRGVAIFPGQELLVIGQLAAFTIGMVTISGRWFPPSP